MIDEKLRKEIQESDAEFTRIVRKSPKTRLDVEEMERLGDELEHLLRREVAPLTSELSSVGVSEDVWGLVDTATSYVPAIPVLIKHLREPYHWRNKEGIVRALAVKEAKGIASKAVLEEYRKIPKDDYHYPWVFGNTMTVIATEQDVADLANIVLDRNNGDSRESFVEALAKLKSPRVIEVLEQLVNDESANVSETARKALKKKQRLKRQ